MSLSSKQKHPNLKQTLTR